MKLRIVYNVEMVIDPTEWNLPGLPGPLADADDLAEWIEDRDGIESLIEAVSIDPERAQLKIDLSVEDEAHAERAEVVAATDRNITRAAAVVEARRLHDGAEEMTVKELYATGLKYGHAWLKGIPKPKLVKHFRKAMLEFIAKEPKR